MGAKEDLEAVRTTKAELLAQIYAHEAEIEASRARKLAVDKELQKVLDAELALERQIAQAERAPGEAKAVEIGLAVETTRPSES